MGRVMPEHGRIPRLGQSVEITVGDPLDVSDLACRCGQPGVNQKQARAPFHAGENLHAKAFKCNFSRTSMLRIMRSACDM